MFIGGTVTLRSGVRGHNKVIKILLVIGIMGTKCSAKFALCCAFLILQASSAPQSQTKSFAELSDLWYGDSCLWESEELRLDMSAYYLNGSYPPHNIAWRIVELGQPLCNDMDLTFCNKGTGKCDCGELRSVLILGDKSRSSFTIEDHKCRFALGAYCEPQDYHPLYKRDAKCVKGSSCIAKDTVKECTYQGITNSTGSANGNGVMDIMRNVLTGTYCSCKENQNNEGQIKKSTANRVNEHSPFYFETFQITLCLFIYFKQ